MSYRLGESIHKVCISQKTGIWTHRELWKLNCKKQTTQLENGQKIRTDSSLKMCRWQTHMKRCPVSYVSRELQIKTIMRLHYILSRMAKNFFFTQWLYPMLAKMWTKWITPTLMMAVENGTATLGKVCHSFETLNPQLPYSQIISLLDIYPREMKIYLHKNWYMNVCSSLIWSRQQLKGSRCPLTSKWLNCGTFMTCNTTQQ